MTRTCVRLVAASCLLSAPRLAGPTAAQPSGTLGIRGSVVRYDGFLTSGAAVLLPTLRFESPRVSLAAQGNLTAFESGNEVIQGTLAGAWLAGSARWWRVELSSSAGAARYESQPATGHLLGGARLHLFGDRAGGWLGVTAGRSSGDRATAPVALTLAGWRASGGIALVGAVTSTWLGADRYLDAQGAIRWTGPKLELEARAGARPWSRTAGEVGDAVTGAFADLTAHVRLASGLWLALGGGSYPSDPVRRVLGASYASVGLRVRAFGGKDGVDPSLDPGLLLRAAPAAAVDADLPRLEIAQAGAGRTLRLRARGARSVDVMADFTDWTPVALTQVAPGTWEATMVIAPGIHRLNIRLDGGEWTTPTGVRSEPTEFGGRVAVVIVR